MLYQKLHSVLSEEDLIAKIFMHKFNEVPSCIEHSFPFEYTKGNLNQLLEELDFESIGAQTISRSWDSQLSKSNKQLKEDYPKYILFESKNRACIILLGLSSTSASIMFYTDLQKSKLEDWMLEKVNFLRQNYKKTPRPTFSVLSKVRGFFNKEQIPVDPISIDLEKQYNEDFLPVHQKITQALSQKGSGLILLHGIPGTGKTSYIKHLISEYKEASFLFIPNDYVSALLDPSFITFLLRNKDIILVIEDAEKVIMSREQQNNHSVVSTILQLTDGLFSDFLNIKVICTFNSDVHKIDSALMRKGRMIARYEFKPLSKTKTRALLKEQGIEMIKEEELSLTEIFNYKENNFAHIQDKKHIGFN